MDAYSRNLKIMKKQVIEIEVPDGKKAVWENGKIRFVLEDPHWKSITTFADALFYVRNYLPECEDLITSYTKAMPDSYELSVICYRIVVAALTNNEKRHLTIGNKWYPVVQFCRPKDKSNCWGNVLIGTIESEGIRYSVVGGDARDSAYAGLSSFDSNSGVSYSDTTIGFRSVSSKEIAQHISTYFGKLLFDVHYGGTNCNWKWVELNQ